MKLRYFVHSLSLIQKKSKKCKVWNFDILKEGDPYTSAHPVIQIGLLNFTFFPNVQNFMPLINFLMLKIILYIVTNYVSLC